MYGKINSTERLLAKLFPSNLVNTILSLRFKNVVKFNLGKKLFAIGFPYKRCNF